MSIRVMSYRLFRLRRLILVSILPPMLIVAAIFALKGLPALAFLPIAIFLPVLHAVRYPNAWTETVAMSLSLSVVLAIAGTVGPDIGLPGLALRVAGLTLILAVLFTYLATALTIGMFAGPEREFTCRARRWSHLDPATLKSAITYYPGRTDDRVFCGKAREDGVFPITLKHQLASSSGEEAKDGDVTLFGVIMKDVPERHELISIVSDSEETNMTQYSFIEKKTGTVVELAERSPPMSLGLIVGYWLQDYLADFLTDEIDRAEGNPARANRFQGHHQLLFDIASLFTGGGNDPHPAE